MTEPLRVLVVGCGNMGASHARAYRALDGFELSGLVSRGPESRDRLAKELGGVSTFGDFAEAFAATEPQVVSINTYPDTHAELALASLRGGAHVFLEKPLAETVEQANEIVAAAKAAQRKLVVGYILRVHPAVAEVHRGGADPGQAPGDAHEPQPAEPRQGVGDPQEP